MAQGYGTKRGTHQSKQILTIEKSVPPKIHPIRGEQRREENYIPGRTHSPGRIQLVNPDHSHFKVLKEMGTILSRDAKASWEQHGVLEVFAPETPLDLHKFAMLTLHPAEKSENA